MQLNERNILTHSGEISHQLALEKASSEYEKFHKNRIEEQLQVENDFEKTLKKIEQAKKQKK